MQKTFKNADPAEDARRGHRDGSATLAPRSKHSNAYSPSRRNKSYTFHANLRPLARDLKFFPLFGFRLDRLEPVDMLPDTYHIERVVEMVREFAAGQCHLKKKGQDCSCPC